MSLGDDDDANLIPIYDLKNFLALYKIRSPSLHFINYLVVLFKLVIMIEKNQLIKN